MFKDKPQSYTAYMILYYTGLRIDEIMALTFADIDLENGYISVNKSIQRLNGNDVITPPKTPKSKRVVPDRVHTGL
ncbi:tyrosine-type recombinase/integrase [[Clostridium] innocuum]|uniref:tyrosine-type recombinase/integrase n=1 Tax=Clostridium innocuum TaxID=1522 RepID=UPI003A5991BE